MRGIVAAEFLRLVSRRLTVVVVILTIAAAALQPLAQIGSIMPLTEQDRQQARGLAQDAQVWHEEVVAECERDPYCLPEDLTVPTERDFLRWVMDFDDYLWMQFGGAGMLLLFALAAWVAIMVGADFRTGSLATQLTFTPNRLRVLGARILTTSVVGVGLAVLATVVALAVSVTAFVMVRSASELSSLLPIAGLVGRLLVTALVVALLAGLLTMLTGSTIATILSAGAVGLVSVVAQGSLRGDSPLLWLLPTTNIEALYTGNFSPYTYYTVNEFQGVVIGFGDAAVYFAVVTIVLAAAAALRFQRRDLMI